VWKQVVLAALQLLSNTFNDFFICVNCNMPITTPVTDPLGLDGPT
jgi:hypothetical protein